MYIYIYRRKNYMYIYICSLYLTTVMCCIYLIYGIYNIYSVIYIYTNTNYLFELLPYYSTYTGKSMKTSSSVSYVR